MNQDLCDKNTDIISESKASTPNERTQKGRFYLCGLTQIEPSLLCAQFIGFSEQATRLCR